MIDEDLDPLIARADLDGLVRLIDARCASRDWAGLLRIRDRSKFALESGRQLWPAATLAEYRLALHAPTEWATRVLDEDGGRFSIGPLTEVVAQNHSWADLREQLPHGPRRAFVAHERGLRGDGIDLHDIVDDGNALDIPLTRQSWEPEYPMPIYSDNGIDAPSPADTWNHEWSPLPPGVTGGERLDDDDVDRALRSLVEPWTASSNGRAESLVVEGDHASALRELGIGNARLAPISSRQALEWLHWCGASGGAHGRRRGGALGRFGVWWMLAAIGGFTDEWDELSAQAALGDECAAVAGSFEWYRFDDGTHCAHELSLIVHDPEDGISIILLARDHPSV